MITSTGRVELTLSVGRIDCTDLKPKVPSAKPSTPRHPSSRKIPEISSPLATPHPKSPPNTPRHSSPHTPDPANCECHPADSNSALANRPTSPAPVTQPASRVQCSPLHSSSPNIA